MNKGLWREVFVMALDTLRTNKMRSGLTVLGVVIGITSIVGMTSLIRGFDESLRDMIRSLGPNTIPGHTTRTSRSHAAKHSASSRSAQFNFQMRKCFVDKRQLGLHVSSRSRSSTPGTTG